MKDEVFSASDIALTCPHDAARVMGFGLMPLSLWHVWFLVNQDSPFIVGGKLNHSEIGLAVITCSRPRARMASLMSNQAELNTISAGVAEKWTTLTTEQRDNEIRILQAYFADQLQGPEFWEESNTDPIKDRQRCPTSWHMVLTLLEKGICRTEEEAWNYSWSRALCWAAVIGEKAGSKNYIDPMDRKQIEEVNRGTN